MNAQNKRQVYQDEMETARVPLLNSFLSILRDVVFDLFLLHKGRQYRLIDRVI